MTEQVLFEELREQFKRQMPFVAYCFPGELKGKAFLQGNSREYHTENFSESGFVFAPFDQEKRAYLIPEERSDKLSWEISENASRGELKKIDRVSEDPLAKSRHLELISLGLDQLKSGKLEKVVLSRKEEIPLAEPDPVNYFQDLLIKYPTAFVYLWYHPKTGCWLAATPEILLDLKGRQISTMALAGTQPYCGSMEVSWGGKEKQEQQLVTDEIVERLNPFASQLEVSPLKTVKAGKLLHLRSDIRAKLEGDGKLKDLLHALHPTPAVCGLPKRKARDFILKEEGYDREFYTGFLGELNLQKSRQRTRRRRNVEQLAYRSVKKETRLFVNLRCMKLERDQAVLYVGGGITRDSQPGDEWKETVNKAGTMKGVLQS